MKEEDIFAEAIDKKTPAERVAHLDQACGGDAELRARVEALLHAHDHPDRFLDDPVANLGETMDHTPVTECAGATIGPYKLRETVGEGGMGVVFVAEQERPMRRKVALKIIKPGMDTKEVIARFEAERQALALMDHPNIAKVLDAGSTESGRPYFVMELVRGIPINEYCDQNKLSIRERLELFIQVCQAIQHAHQKGIIHRDVKPSNVLVSLHDGKPVPKVIDFGVAKATNQRLTERTIYTRFAQIIGTPMYMSPEQAQLSGLDVDTRSDIYSLGVLLYELLTGSTPFDKERFEKAAYDEMRRIIREEEPPRPSTKITTLGDKATSVSERRGTDPSRLRQLIRGDLDWIAMKALEKDRTRRYESASAFAADIQHLMNDEPVEARPPSRLYRFRKFVRRNKVQVISGSVLGVAVLIAAWAVLVNYVQKQSWKNERSRFVLDNALAYAMSGNKQLAISAIERARNDQVPESWTEMLYGQLALYAGGEEAAAIDHLSRAVELAPRSVTPRAMLAVAHAFAGDTNTFDRLVNELERQTPENDMDRVFMGQALLYRSTPRGLQMLQEAVGPGSPPLFHAVRADALVHHSMETGDVGTAEEAVRYLEATATFMPDSVYVLTVSMCAHMAAIRLNPEPSPRAIQLRTRAAELADTLRRFRHYPTASSVRAYYYECIGDDQAALQACLEAVNHGGRGYARSQAASVLYRLGRYDEAEKLLRSDAKERNPWVLFARAEVLAFSPTGPSEIKRIYESLVQERAISKYHIKYHIPETVLLQQANAEYRIAACEKRLASDDLDHWERYVLRFIADRIGDEEFLQAARSSKDKPRLNESRAEKLIAMKALLVGQRGKAVRHFQACVALGYLGDHDNWATAFLRRLQNDSCWPEGAGVPNATSR